MVRDRDGKCQGVLKGTLICIGRQGPRPVRIFSRVFEGRFFKVCSRLFYEGGLPGFTRLRLEISTLLGCPGLPGDYEEFIYLFIYLFIY
jgi:hypothetical protein